MQKYAIGVDLGGTKIEFALVSFQGELLDKLRVPTSNFKKPEEFIICISDTLEKFAIRHPDITPSAIGLGVAGQVEKDTGTIINAPNLGWENIPLQQELTNKLHKPVVVCNDVKAAAWGEWQHGSGMGSDDMVCIFVGTGIGGAIISSGKMIEGCNNTAGEVGHIILQMNGPLCHCGNKGCFEALAGGWAIQRDVQLAVKNNAKEGKTLLELAGENIQAINAETVSKALAKGDVLAGKLIDNVVEVLTAGIASVVNMLGPCRIILGGGVIEGMPQLIDRVQEGVKKYALKTATASVDILPAKLHNDSGVIGAAAFALQTLK